MVKVQHNMSLHDETVQKLGNIKVPRARRERKEREHPVDLSVKSNHKLLAGVHEGVCEKALEIAEGNWRRLEVVDSTTVVVHNKEVH